MLFFNVNAAFISAVRYEYLVGRATDMQYLFTNDKKS